MDNAYLPAFPIRDDSEYKSYGLSKREYIAAKGSWTQTELNQMAYKIKEEMNKGRESNDYVGRDDIEVLMKTRVRLADKLLHQLGE